MTSGAGTFSAECDFDLRADGGLGRRIPSLGGFDRDGFGGLRLGGPLVRCRLDCRERLWIKTGGDLVTLLRCVLVALLGRE